MAQYWKHVRELIRPGIGRRMTLLILLFSSVVTLLLTALQLTFEFNHDVSSIEAQLVQIRSSYSKSLANSLWVDSKADVAVQLEGIHQLPDMAYIEILSEQDQVVTQVGELLSSHTLRLETPLYYTHRDQSVYVGKLLTVANLNGAYQRLTDKVLVILLSQFFKTFLVSFFTLFLFQWLVGRYLKRIADYSACLQAKQLDQPLDLHRAPQRSTSGDELDQLVNSINAMRANLQTSTRELLESEYRWKFALEGSGDGVWDWDIENNHVFYSERFKAMLGYSAEVDWNTFKDWEERYHPEDRPKVIAAVEKYLKGESRDFWSEYRIQCKDGSWKWHLSHGMVVSRDAAGNKALRLIGSSRDITQRKESEALIWKQANFDTLTGLPNRAMFHDRLQQEILKSGRGGLRLALLLIDLDQFKEVNDALGHDVGDSLLQDAAGRIRHCVRESDTVARLGGDEFTVIIPDLPDTGHLDEIAHKLIAALASPYQLANEIIHVSASVGISLYPGDASDIDALVKNADQAMYAAKNQGRNRFSYFTPAMQEAAQFRLRLGRDMHLALEREEFLLHYQPQISTTTGRVTGVEALVRWQHPEMGLLLPGKFISIAEDTGLILPLGEWVILRACRQLRQWQDQGMLDVQMSVNLSARQFRQKTLTTAVAALLNEAGIDPSALELEITESLAMDNPQENAKTLVSLQNIGVTLAIDDFGTGHSSLGYLRNFPLNRLKLDRSFIMNLGTDTNDAIIVAAAINLSHDLGMQVVAEGVETHTQVEYLLRFKCDTIQGYHFSKPLSGDAVGIYIRERNALPHPLFSGARV